MRFLCLHGRGTNSDILESQLQSLLSLLPSNHTYDFVDGEFPCEPAAGIDLFYSGPYLCYYNRHDTTSIRSALNNLQDIIEEDGPFDGIIGFSQGAALVSSLLLCHQLEKPGKPLPFKLAIFLSGGLPLSPSPNIGKDFTLEAKTAESAARILFSSAVHQTRNENISETSTPGSENPDFEFQIPVRDSEKIFCFDPDFFDSKAVIGIPTVHIMGTNDPWIGYSKALVRLCRKDLARVAFHGGAHEVPRDKASLRVCKGLIEGAVGMVERGLGGVV